MNTSHYLATERKRDVLFSKENPEPRFWRWVAPLLGPVGMGCATADIERWAGLIAVRTDGEQSASTLRRPLGYTVAVCYTPLALASSFANVPGLRLFDTDRHMFSPVGGGNLGILSVGTHGYISDKLATSYLNVLSVNTICTAHVQS